MLSKFQSGFRPNHSTVTALFQMYDEWLANMDNGKLNGVVFLHIKKSFDPINHDILTTKMNEHFGIIGMELNWFKSYLTNREQQSLSTVSCHLRKNNLLSPPGINPRATFVSIIH